MSYFNHINLISIQLDLQKHFQWDDKSFNSFVRLAPTQYQFFSIPKRSGGVREIAKPAAILAQVQKFIIQQYFKNCPIHPAACAYIKGKNILEFAQPHQSHRYLLKLDFKDFFSSIKIDDFYRYCQLPETESRILGRLLFCKNKKNHKQNDYYLSIGSPSSPTLSNILMYEFDKRISDFCQNEHIAYTRYADDLAFSTNIPNILYEKLIKYFFQTCKSLDYPKRLRINSRKTVFTSKKYNRTLTGLVIANNGTLSIGRDKKRNLRAMAYQASQGLLSEEKVCSLKGHIAFLKGIDPQFAQILQDKLEEKRLFHS